MTDGGIVYAGETEEFKAWVNVNPRVNKTVTGSETEKYATKVPEAKVKFKLTYSTGEYEEFDAASKKNFSGSNENNPFKKDIDIEDLPAGTTIEVVACVYPSDSGDEKNWQDKKGSDNWACTEPNKFTVAKRPSFQVWGGGVYSNGGVLAPASIKNKLAGIGGDNTVVFGSWAEQAVVSNGTVNGLASGAATGLNFEYNDTVANGITEGTNRNFCNNRSPLSFANKMKSGGCPNAQNIGRLGAKNSVLDRKSLVSYIISNTEDDNLELLKLTANAEGDYILNKDNEYGNTVQAGKTRVVIIDGGENSIMATGTITITDDILYKNYDEPFFYHQLEDIPKVIVYANNINIGCNVRVIDAILIAEDTINTCPSNADNSESVNDQKNSNRLIVNGILIANKIEFNRTYGANIGINSGVPAEIINHDSSTTLWSMSQVDTDNYAGLTTVYQHELAPRY